jgi:hypothetical protein
MANLPTSITIVPGLSISVTDTTVLNSQPSIITPGQASYKATYTLFQVVFTTSNSAYLNVPFSTAAGLGGYLPIVYVRNIDTSNPVNIQFSTIGLGQTFTTRLFPGGFFFLWIPVAAALGGGSAGIEASTGVGIEAVAPAVNSPVEVFYAA